MKAATTYTNPVSAGTVDTFPDPAIIKGKDGRWWSYGTTNPIFNSRGETGEHILPTLSSTDLVHWTYAGDVFPRHRETELVARRHPAVGARHPATTTAPTG